MDIYLRRGVLCMKMYILTKEKWEGFMSDYSSENIREIYERHFVTVYRVCFMYLRNVHDTEDAVHNTFMKLIEKQKCFESTEHEKHG